MVRIASCGRIAALLVVSAFGPGAADLHAQLGGVDVSTSVDFYYGYDFNGVDPDLRTFDVAHNAFSLSLAELALERMPSPQSRVGGRIDLNFGATADIVGSAEPGGATAREAYKHIQQAFISALAADDLVVDVGKFVTPIGAEVIESQDNWNYTRSILFGFAIPFYHTGVRATYVASDRLSLSGYLVNGWNNTLETNSDKTFAASAAFAANEQVSWVANFMAGNEDDVDGDGEEDLRWLFDTTLSFAATDMLTLMANFDYGQESDLVATDEAGSWWGIAAYARYQPRETWAFAGRFEHIDDSDGGFMGIGQTAQSLTLTSDHRLWNDLITRIEFRFDTVENDFFNDDEGTATQNQPSLTLGMVYQLN